MQVINVQQGEKVYARGRNGYFKPTIVKVLDYDPEKKAIVAESCRKGNDFPVILSLLNEDAQTLGNALLGEMFTDLWACRETLHDGENEYGCEFLVRANSFEEAEIKAWHYVKDNYTFNGGEDEDRPYTDFLNEDGAIEIDGDYRVVKAEVCRPIQSLKDLLGFINVVTFSMADIPEGKAAVA